MLNWVMNILNRVMNMLNVSDQSLSARSGEVIRVNRIVSSFLTIVKFLGYLYIFELVWWCALVTIQTATNL